MNITLVSFALLITSAAAFAFGDITAARCCPLFYGVNANRLNKAL